MAYFISAFYQYVCLHMYVARQRIAKHVTAAMNTQATKGELFGASFSKRSVSY
jgi:hypothetical protein